MSMQAFISARRAKRRGEKPYPTNPRDWLKFFIILLGVIVISFIITKLI